MIGQWWVWVAGGLVLGLIEVVIPGYVFVGFALGAIVTGLLLLSGIWPAGWMAEGIANHLLVFAIISLISWLALRRVLGVRRGQVKLWDRDINEN